MTGLAAHLAGGHSTVARAWALTRRDGVTLGFTDHDETLSFEGILFRPDEGLSASALVQGSGLAVDNAEVLGVLSDAAIREEDIAAGRYDGAGIRLWWVNWRKPEERVLRFRGTLGEIRRLGGAFQAEVRGLTEALNQPLGRVFHRDCSAVLGDGACRVDLGLPGMAEDRTVEICEENRVFRFADLDLPPDRWFERGQFRVLSGAAAGLSGIVKHDRRLADGSREIALWASLPAPVLPGDQVRIEPGCDKRFATCREKFANTANFRGFPHLPSEDWLIAVPRPGRAGGRP
jgi:uncharacterized phage protein (TIGR02218 family)